jgi:opacity protein-like surface antigen
MLPKETKTKTGEARTMRNLATLSWMALCLLVLAQAGQAQKTPPPPGSTENKKDHGNIGAFFNYTRLQDQSLNLFGVGGRIGFRVVNPVMLEAEMAYDFERTQTQAITVGSVTNTVRTNVRLLHALFGPKVQTKGPMHLFLLGKVGIVNFGVGGPVTAGAINNQIGTIVNGDTNLAVYPGAGIEFNIKSISFRAEAGDEVIFLRGNTTNNVRVAIGPQIRF